VVIVGSFGLASNLVGLFLFHEHSHSHSHSHDHSLSNGHSHADAHEAVKPSSASASVPAIKAAAESDTASDSEEEMYSAVGPGHPVMTRASIVRVAHNMAHGHSPSTSRRGLSYDDHNHGPHHTPSEDTPLLSDSSSSSATYAGHSHSHSNSPEHADGHSHDHSPAASNSKTTTERGHSHGHGHSHAGSMNMRALVLHVLGDALGNVGVIATGLIIMLAPASWGGREAYFDPAISLVIAFIILGSAVPLVRSASFVLLQGVPSTISLEQVRAAILAVEGVQSLHELHIWQLSESKNIASVHVLASRELDFMPIAAKIRKALHDHGIHSCTIQPEYYGARYRGAERVLEASSPDTACLVLCPPEECNPQEDACCPPPAVDV